MVLHRMLSVTNKCLTNCYEFSLVIYIVTAERVNVSGRFANSTIMITDQLLIDDKIEIKCIQSHY